MGFTKISALRTGYQGDGPALRSSSSFLFPMGELTFNKDAEELWIAEP